MITKTDVFHFLSALSIERNQCVLIHTSLKQLGEIDGGAEGLLSMFRDYLCDGLLLVPTFTYLSVNRQNPVYNVRTTPACIGVLPQIAATLAFQWDHAARSLHPTHSVAAFGKNAEDFIAGEEKSATPTPVGGVFFRLNDVKAKILLLGVGMNRNTYFHALDEELNLPGRISPDPYPITVIDQDGNPIQIPAFAGHRGHCWDFYDNYEKPLRELGAVRSATLGSANVLCCDVPSMHDAVLHMWEKADYDLCSDHREIPESYYRVK